MARQDMFNVAAPLEYGVQGIDGGARNPERAVDALQFHHQNSGFDCSHFGHLKLLHVGLAAAALDLLLSPD